LPVLKQSVLFLFCLILFSFVTPDDIDILLPQHVNDCEMVSHKNYVLCYNEKCEQANWVCYTLTEQMCANGQVKRSNNFYSDPLISTGSALPDDYKLSGYDRGHLCPAGDMKFSEQSMKESFYMSNMSPQVPAFNRGIWKKLEEQVRVWAVINKELHITVGGILQDSLPTIGKLNKVAVPDFFYKVILDNEGVEKKAIGFIMPNKKLAGSIYNYAVSVDSVEKVTGINFFYDLTDSLEAKLEMHYDTLLWK